MASRLYPLLADRAWLEHWVDRGATNAAIAAEIGCSPASVQRAVMRLGLSGRRSPARPELRSPLLADRDWMRARRNEGLTLEEIAAEAGVAVESVSNWIARHGLAATTTNPQLSDCDWLFARIDAGETMSAIADQAGSNSSTVRAWIDRHGLQDHWEDVKARPVRAELADRAWLFGRLDAGASRAAIAHELGVGRATVAQAVDAAGLGGIMEVTQREKRTALLRHLAGESVTAIARSSGRKGATIQAWIREAGHEPVLERYSPEEKRAVIERLSLGVPATKIAAEQHIDPTTVRLWRRQADSAREEGRDWP